MKSGTHSMDNIFGVSFRSAHEHQFQRLATQVTDFLSDNIGRNELMSMLLWRDRISRLEFESSHLLTFALSELVELFPRAKFVLTFRNFRSWLESMVDHQIRRTRPREDKVTLTFHEAVFGPLPEKYEKHEKILAEHNLYPLASYIHYWKHANEYVLRCVPSERLMIVRTIDIGRSQKHLASFFKVDAERFRGADIHAYRAPEKLSILRQLDHDYLEQKMDDNTRVLEQQMNERTIVV